MRTLLEILDLSNEPNILVMKLICSAGHVYDTENISHRWWKGERIAGQKCPEVISYDVMSKPKTTRCNRKLKRLDEQTLEIHKS